MSEFSLVSSTLAILVICSAVLLWLVWQARQSSRAQAQMLTEQAHMLGELKGAFSKMMLNIQRATTILESSHKEQGTIEALIGETKQSAAMLHDTLVVLQSSLSGEMQMQAQAQLQQIREFLEHEFIQQLNYVVQEHIGQQFEQQFQHSFESLQLALPDLLREDFTNIFGTELDLIQKQVETTLEHIANTLQMSSDASEQEPELYEQYSAIQEHLDAIRKIQADVLNRQSELHFAVREMVQGFAAVESFMQEVTDIPRLAEHAMKKYVQDIRQIVQESLRVAQYLPQSQDPDIRTFQPDMHQQTEHTNITNSAEASITSNEQTEQQLLTYNHDQSHDEYSDNTAPATVSTAHADSHRSVLTQIVRESFEEKFEQSQAKPLLLIVDDSITNLSMLKHILHDEMFELMLVTSGQEALQAVRTRTPDIVLLDVVLPDIDGYHVCNQLKHTATTRDIPIIFMSGVNDTEAIVKGFDAGGSDYIIKPFQKAEILARLKFHHELYQIRRQQHLYIAQIQREREKSDHLLKSILPETIAERLKKGEGSIADGLSNVGVMFADIVGFTKLSAHISPRELVDMLNVVFSSFDTLTQNYGLEKIKTIGDAYMVAGGLSTSSRPDHLVAMADLALEMMQEIQRCAEFLNMDLSLRIGIHCGEATAGVIGQNRFTYDLWGDTVNTASRMESHGEPRRIHCSEAVYRSLRDTFAFEERGSIEIKSKGYMNTYFLIGRKALDT
ncbi:MAG: adenylate/guanylate cyclase domain-containing protein [Bacteroidota bacterium]|nr:response regulator [Candidatus Kapabacteria bacterium]MDW8219036.1 adenylate/guanylate cyclase domain-containing protein [Bacteroidota bacterium]